MSYTFDYIITGAGCAGLSLAYHMLMAQELSEKKILLIDASDKSQNDKTWCFWSDQTFGFKCTEKFQWQELSFKTEKISKSENIAPLTYHHIASLDFYNEVKTLISKADNCQIIQSTVTNIKESSGGVIVETTSGRYASAHVFNSIPNLILHKPGKIKTWQHFYGLHIRTETDVFDPGKVTLMDFNLENKNQVQFWYVLPFARNEALIEYTEFSENIHGEQTYQAYLQGFFEQSGIGSYELIDKECGKIPMSDFSFSKSDSPSIHHIGTSGGMTKPTTGYTFRNIQLDSFKIVNSLIKNTPIERRLGKRRYKFYDKLLLGIINEQPELVKPIMSHLFKKNHFSRILRFLDEESSIWDEIRIFSSIPWAPFLNQLIKR